MQKTVKLLVLLFVIGSLTGVPVSAAFAKDTIELSKKKPKKAKKAKKEKTKKEKTSDADADDE